MIVFPVVTRCKSEILRRLMPVFSAINMRWCNMPFYPVSSPMRSGRVLSLSITSIFVEVLPSLHGLGFLISLTVARISRLVRQLLQFGIFGMHKIKPREGEGLVHPASLAARINAYMDSSCSTCTHQLLTIGVSSLQVLNGLRHRKVLSW
jgi:hypothetical protein